jgi:hypothetical protein
MKKYKYHVFYANGKDEIFYCNSFGYAIILAMAHAIKNAWGIDINYIIDEKGNKVSNIERPTFKETK